MRRFGIIAVFVWSTAGVGQVDAQVIQQWGEVISRPFMVGAEQLQVPNTSGGDEFATQVFVTRDSTRFLTSYMFKDRNQFNSIFLDSLYFEGRRDDGVWVRCAALNYSCGQFEINWDMLFFHLWFELGPDFSGYATGDRIDFRWKAYFRGGFCLQSEVQKIQEFQLIKGEPLPIFPGQYPSSTHNHNFYTDNLGESGGSREHLRQYGVVGGRIYWWTDHGYDLTAAECQQMLTDASSRSDTRLIILGGVEGNIDDNTTNELPDGFLHTLTNVCLRTPWEFPGDNSSGQLWNLAQFQDSVAARGGLWAAAHPFSAFPVPGISGSLGVWQSQHVVAAMADPNFLGWQIWNRERSSTRRVVNNLNYISPYPWTDDLNARQGLEFSLAQVDAIQQQHLTPLRPAWILAGDDDHWDRAYALSYNAGGQVEVHNAALGRCFTVAEMPSLAPAEYWEALQQGRTYLTNGPGCRFGVDLDQDGILDTTFGQIHDGGLGVIRLVGQSNAEFGPFTRAIIYTLTPTARDSLVIPIGGMTSSIDYPVPTGADGPTAIRARLETAGGYGDADGLVLTSWLFFNTATVGVETPPGAFRLTGPWPNPSQGKVLWTITLSQPQFLTVNILDVSGRRLSRLFAGLTSGSRQFSWDGKDSRGQTVSSGVYLIEMIVAGQRHLRKIAFLR